MTAAPAKAVTSKTKLAFVHYDHVPRTVTFSMFVSFCVEYGMSARASERASSQKDKPYLHINVINLHAAINSFGFGCGLVGACRAQISIF